MDRETMRRIESFRRNEAGPIENNLIDELVNGELDRTEFLKRGAVFGLSVGMMGSLLGLVGEAGAATGATTQLARVQAGGTIRVGLTAGGSLEPYLLNDGGSLALAGIPGEYLTFTDPEGQDRAVARHELEAERGRDRVDVPAAQGRQVPQRQDDDLGGRRREHEAVRRGEGVERRPDAVLRRRGRLREGPLHGRLPAQVRDRRVPVPRQPDDVPGDHPAGGAGGHAREVGCGRDDRHRRLQAQEVRRQEERRARAPRRLLGWPPAARRRQGHVLPGLGADGARAAGRADRPRHAALAAGGAGLQEQLEVQDLQPADGGAPAALHAHRPGRAQGPARAPCGRARDQPSAAALEGHARRRDGRQRQPVLEGLRVDRPVRQAAHAEPRAREGACSRPRVPRT